MIMRNLQNEKSGPRNEIPKGGWRGSVDEILKGSWRPPKD